jgi:hypothetical protein
VNGGSPLELAALLLDPVRAAEVPADKVPAVLAALAVERDRLAGVERVLLGRLIAEGPGDRLVNVNEAATRLGVEVNWLRHHNELPFIVRPSAGVVRYSSRGMDQWIASRRGKGT